MAVRRTHIQRQTSRQSLRGRTLLKQGYLKKVPQSGLVAVVKKYTERWFVFGVNALEPFLEYYENEDSVFTTAPINTISLATCRQVSHNILETKYDSMFTITTAERQLNLVAKDRSEMGRWCNVISSKLSDLGILTNAHSRPNVYEELPKQRSLRAQRPLPPAPGDAPHPDSATALPPPAAHVSSYQPGHHVYVNTSLPPKQDMPPPLPPRPISSQGSVKSDDLLYFPSTSSTNSSDFEDPFEALAAARAIRQSQNLTDENGVADLVDIVLQEDNNNTLTSKMAVNGGDLFNFNDRHVEITPDLRNLTGLRGEVSDSDDENEGQYSPIWQQSSSTSAGQGAISSMSAGQSTKTTAATPGVTLSNSGSGLSSIANPRVSNDYGDHPQQKNNQPVPSYLPRQLSFSPRSTDTGQHPPAHSNTMLPSPTSNTTSLPAFSTTLPPQPTHQSASSPNLQNSADDALSRKCAEVDATNPLLMNSMAPPPYSADAAAPSPHAPLSPHGAASPLNPPEYTESNPLPPLPGSVPLRRHQRHSLSCMQQLRSPMERCKSLKQSQVELLQQEINNPGGVFVQVKRNDCFQTLAVIDMLGAVWVAGWAYSLKPFLHNAFHIGDQIVSVGGHVIKCAQDVNKIIKHSPAHQKVVFNIRRVPHGKVLAIVRTVDGESLGFQRVAGTAEIVSVNVNGLASEFGLTSKAQTMDGSSLCNWMLTEVNMRPLNLFFKDNEIEHRLNAVGKDISIMVQPSDFIYLIKKKLKALKNYKEYLVM